MADILAYTIWGNNLVQIALYIGILLAAILGTKLVYWLFKKVFRTLATKTKTRLDDLIVEALEKPVIFAIVLLGLYFGKGVLTFSDLVLEWYTKIFEVLIIICVTWFVVKIVDAFLANYIQPIAARSKSVKDDMAFPILKRLVNFFIYVIAIVFIIQHLGYNVTGLVAGLGIGGLAFALAAQDILANLFGGASIVADKPFKLGDRVVFDGNDGFVKKIGMRSTQLETFDGTVIVVPNKKISDSILENISRERARRTKIVLGVEYSTPTKKLELAKKLIKDIIKKNKSTDDDSLIHFKGFGPSSLDIQAIYWIKDLDNILGARDEVNFEIKKAFEKNGIEFAYPSQTIYVKK